MKTENGYILVDAGMPNKDGQLNEVFQQYGVDPKSVKLIILTHGHLDHVGSAAYVHEITGVKILCHLSYVTDLGNGKIEPAIAHIFSGRILNSLLGLLGSKIGRLKADIIVDEEDARKTQIQNGTPCQFEITRPFQSPY